MRGAGRQGALRVAAQVRCTVINLVIWRLGGWLTDTTRRPRLTPKGAGIMKTHFPNQPGPLMQCTGKALREAG